MASKQRLTHPPTWSRPVYWTAVQEEVDSFTAVGCVAKRYLFFLYYARCRLLMSVELSTGDASMHIERFYSSFLCEIPIEWRKRRNSFEPQKLPQPLDKLSRLALQIDMWPKNHVSQIVYRAATFL